MGQRLVVSVIKDEQRIAVMYFHWSAYTQSALWEAQKIIDAIDRHEQDDLRLCLIRYCEENGGCIDGGKDSREFKAIQEMYPNETFKESGSRNEGLIALTEDGMNDLEGWSEGDLAINLDDGYVYNYVYGINTLDEYNEWMEEDNKLEDFPLLDIDLGAIEFEKLDDVIHGLDNAPFNFRNSDNEIVQLIA